MPTASELPIDTTATSNQMAEAMFGDGITIVSSSYTGAAESSGIYSNGDSTASALTPSDTGVILSTGRATDVTNSSGDVNTSASTSGNMGTAGDADLTAISGGQTFDAAIFEAEFVPAGSTLTMQFVFSSEEYLEYVNSGFNDAVGVWVNGVQAELYIGDGDISIDNINDQSNSNLYVDNAQTDDSYNTEMDGFTVTLTLKAPVNPDEVNTIKIAIADSGDSAYDSNLLIAGDSVQTELVAQDDEFLIEGDGSESLDVLGNDASSSNSTLTITHINGQPISAGDTIVLSTGEEITLNADGTFSIENVNDSEEPETNMFTYTVADELGNTDIGYVEVTTAGDPGTACFVAGTRIATLYGGIAVENLKVGDLVKTRDNGHQPLRWIGRSTRQALGNNAPVVFEKGAMGDHDRIELSPNHRVLVASDMAELLFGQPEVLVKAAHLVNGDSIQLRNDGREVTYLHLLFDQHEIVTGNGLESESYHPGAETLDAFDEDTRNEVLAFFPDLASYGPTARPTLKAHEGQLLAR